MRIGRTLPPAAVKINYKDIFSGLKGVIRGSEEVNRFESELKKHYKVKHCYLVSSGKAALTIILKALHELHPERKEVLIPAYTCYSVPSAIIKAGLKVKLCDINPETLDFDFEQLEKILSPVKPDKNNNSILAIIPTHLFGLPVNVDRVRKLVKNDMISIIEDGAQAMGGNKQKIGTLGDVGFFSLGRGKAFSTIEGGIILTNNNSMASDISKQMKKLPDYSILEVIKLIIVSFVFSVFMRPALFWIPKLLPFLKLGQTHFDPVFSLKKISSFQAGLTKNWLVRLKKMNSIRKQKARIYFENLKKDGKLTSSVIKQNNNNFFLRVPVKIDDEIAFERILSKSEKLGYGIMSAYPNSINNINELAGFFTGDNYPEAYRISKQLLTLPAHVFLSNADIINIKKLIENEYGF